MTRLACDNDGPRRARLRATGRNGLDWAEVEPDGRTVALAFVGPAPEIEAANVRVTAPDGTIAGVAGVSRCNDDDRERDACVEVHLVTAGSGDGYRVCLVDADPDGRPSRRPMAGLDPRLTCADLSFDTGCAADEDCACGGGCAPETFDEPEIPYLARDYEGLRSLVLDRLALVMPDWTERHAPDLGITLVELLAYVGDELSYQQDAVATEAYLDTARLRTSVRRHVRLIGYPMHDGLNARAWVSLRVTAPVELRAGEAWFITTPVSGDLPPDTEITSDDLRSVPPDAYEVFEPMVADDVALLPSRNEIHLWTWGERECCLPLGATSATLLDVDGSATTGATHVASAGGDASPTAARPASGQGKGRKGGRDGGSSKALPARVLGLQPGDLILFEEVRGAVTGAPADADPGHRQVVRITAVTPAVDEAFRVPVLEVEWSPEDALTFPLCVSAVAGERCELVEVSVGRGNVILVDHGRRTDRCDAPPEVLCVPCTAPGPRACVEDPCTHAYEPGDRTAGTPAFRPALALPEITFAEPFPAPGRAAERHAAILRAIPARVRARLRHIWAAARDRGRLGEPELEDLRILFGDAVLARAGLGEAAEGADTAGHAGFAGHAGPGHQPGREVAEAVGWLVGRSDHLLERKLQRVSRLARRVRAGYPLSTAEAGEIAAALGPAYAAGLDDGPATLGAASSAMTRDPRAALPVVTLVEDGGEAWTPRRDLLESRTIDRVFVLEVDDDGVARLRFGDGTLGRAVEAGGRLLATYRVGAGRRGNVHAGAITRLVRCPGVTGPTGRIASVTNPLAASGGLDPEPVAEVKLLAPSTVRRSERAVTAADYASVAGEVRGVQRAGADLRWTGSWYEASVGVDAIGAEDPAEELVERVAERLHRVRRIGHDLRVGAARKVAIDLALRVCVLPTFERGAVERAVRTALLPGRRTDGSLGFFDPDRLTFGTGVHASAIVGLVQAVPGVESVTITTFERRFEGPAGELDAGELVLGALEIAELDPAARPARGRLRLDMRGGR